MRLAGRLRAGYFPCPEKPLELLAERLVATTKPFAMLDPCAGLGEAAHKLAEGIGGESTLYCVELDPSRGETIRQRLPAARVLSPASIFQTNITHGSFGLVYCNPPFDDAMDGGRIETTFLLAVTPLVCERGVIVMVVPEKVTEDTYFQAAMEEEFEDISQGEFPAEDRHYNEVFVVGIRRKEPKRPAGRWRPADLWQTRYAIPPSKGPGKRFSKSGYTDEELIAALESSPLQRMTAPKKAVRIPVPPMALGPGHLALMLAAGYLDGVIDPGVESEVHLVRGVAAKHWHHKESATEVTEDCKRTVTVLEEKMLITVRAAYQNGEIVDFTDGTEPIAEENHVQAS
jgi:hypothetical protein